MKTNNFDNDIFKCATLTKYGDMCKIVCKKDIWSVHGQYEFSLLNTAYKYFLECKDNGEYDDILNKGRGNENN